MKILLIGASGQLGGELLGHGGGHRILAPPRTLCDLERPAQCVALIADERPDVVINCAAFHDLPACESDPASALRINCIAVRALARACAGADARLVTFSTDYVFGGARSVPWQELDAPQPLQVYGISRLAGEYAALAEAPAHALVIRTCGLYARCGSRSRGGNFVLARMREALAGGRIEMACEQVVSPTSAADLAVAVLALLAHPDAGAGIYHLVNEGACSWYEFTCEIVRLLGAPAAVVAVDRGARSGAMRRPRYSALANTRAAALGIRLRPWRDALAEFIESTAPGGAPLKS